MRRIMAIATSAGLLASPALAERLTHEQLHAYYALAPAAPAGWKRADRGAPHSSDLTSNLGVTYSSEDGGKRFGFVITFSKDHADHNRVLLRDAKKRDTWGYRLEKIKGRDVLVKKTPETHASSTYLTVLSDKRLVAIIEFTPGIERAVLKAFFETIDFEAIARKR